MNTALLKKRKIEKGGSETLLQIDYNYGKDGNRLSKTISGTAFDEVIYDHI